MRLPVATRVSLWWIGSIGCYGNVHFAGGNVTARNSHVSHTHTHTHRHSQDRSEQRPASVASSLPPGELRTVSLCKRLTLFISTYPGFFSLSLPPPPTLPSPPLSPGPPHYFPLAETAPFRATTNPCHRSSRRWSLLGPVQRHPNQHQPPVTHGLYRGANRSTSTHPSRQPLLPQRPQGHVLFGYVPCGQPVLPGAHQYGGELCCPGGVM